MVRLTLFIILQLFITVANANNTVQITNQGMALDIFKQTYENETNVQIFDNWNGPNQKWVLEEVSMGSYLIKNGNMCLDVFAHGTTDETNVQIFKCHGQKNQLWKIEFLPTPNGSDNLQIIGQESGKCLDIYRKQKTNESNVQIFRCHYGVNQLWSISEAL